MQCKGSQIGQIPQIPFVRFATSHDFCFWRVIPKSFKSSISLLFTWVSIINPSPQLIWNAFELSQFTYYLWISNYTLHHNNRNFVTIQSLLWSRLIGKFLSPFFYIDFVFSFVWCGWVIYYYLSGLAIAIIWPFWAWIVTNLISQVISIVYYSSNNITHEEM